MSKRTRRCIKRRLPPLGRQIRLLDRLLRWAWHRQIAHDLAAQVPGGAS